MQPTATPKKSKTEIKEEEAREAAIIRAFRFGARIPVAKKIWNDLLDHELKADVEADQKDAVSKWLIEESALSKGLKRGAMSLDQLVVILSHMEWEFDNLDEMPHRRLRALEGHRKAVEKARAFMSHGKEILQISEKKFLSLWVLNQDAKFKEKKYTRFTNEEWKQILDRVTPILKKELLVGEGEKIPVRTKSQFKVLLSTWQKAFELSFVTVPYKWEVTKKPSSHGNS